MSSFQDTLRFEQAAAAPRAFGTAAPPRMTGLDWLRAGAALAVVALHSGMPYMTHPLPSLEWCVRSADRSAVVDALCWAINGAVMPTFFLMGGFLAAGLWRRAPGGVFLAHRTRRLLGPLVFAFFVVLPADMYVWLIGWYTQGIIPWQKVLSMKLASPLSGQFWGVAHLWYLECLWTLSAVACVAMWLRARSAATNSSQSPPIASAGSRWTFLAPLIAGAILACDPTFLIGFQQTWWPAPSAMAFYGIFFAAGWRSAVVESTPLRKRPGLIDSNRVRLLGGAVLFAALLPLLHLHVAEALTGLRLLGLTTLFASFAWLTSTTLLRSARSFRGESVPRSVAFVAEASFWMYLVHHPVAGLTQLAMLNSTLPALVKFLATLMIATGLSLASYGVFVRRTWLGQLLNGRGQSRAVEARGRTAVPEDVPVRRAA